MRTPQNVVALDWQTGKRIWETREEESSARDQYLSEFMSDNNGDEFAAMNHPLEQRVWDDTLTMSLSSDGERVFALGGMSLGERDDQSAWNVGPGFGGPFDFTAAPTNRLTAYELATEGKLAWEIDGANAAGDLVGRVLPRRAGRGRRLALCARRNPQRHLSARPRTRNRQTPVAAATRRTRTRHHARSAAPPQRATPSYSAGILVCPTTAGIVVAVDAIRREFAWVYRYPRQIDSFANMRPGWQGRADVAFARGNNRWLDGSAVIADGKVLAHAARVGRDALPRSGHRQTALEKAPRQIALPRLRRPRKRHCWSAPIPSPPCELADGAAAWPKEFALPDGVLPAGLGYLSEGRYFLPLTSGQVIAHQHDRRHVDRRDRRAERRQRRKSDLPSRLDHLAVGDCSSTSSSRSKSSANGRRRPWWRIRKMPRRFATSPKCAGSKARSPKPCRCSSKPTRSIRPISLTRDMLADALLEALDTDYAAYRADLPLLRKIVDRPQQQIDLLRIDARGLDAAGERMEAFAAYLRLVDATAADLTSLTISPQHSARSDSWIRAQLNALWSAATPDERRRNSRGNWTPAGGLDEAAGDQRTAHVSRQFRRPARHGRHPPAIGPTASRTE